MKFSAVLAVAATASAATLQKKQSSSLDIDNFSAGCVPHSTECLYSFEVLDDPSLPPSHCSAFVQGPDSLPAVENGSCEDNVAYTWSITPDADSGLDFAIWYPFSSRSNVTYCATITSDELTTENDGTANVQRYTGPANFTANLC